MQVDDDLPVGRILSRRDVVRLLAITGAGAFVGCQRGQTESAGGSVAALADAGQAGGNSAALPQCIAKPELEIGPYFLDNQLDRSDIRVDPTTNVAKAGAPLLLAFNVQQIANGRCTPLPNAIVDIWQCDADGAYSGFRDNMVGFDTTGQKFLRGYQTTDANGKASFVTIYPGWYRGRAVHIHFKIRTPEQYEFTSQLFFDDELSDRVHSHAPYNAKGERDRRNQSDRIFREGGQSLLLATVPDDQGYKATFDIGLDLSDAQVGRPDGMRRRPR